LISTSTDFSTAWGNLFDFSKNRITEKAMQNHSIWPPGKPAEWIEAMFSGRKINATENRAVLHCSAEPVHVGVDSQDMLRVNQVPASCARSAEAFAPVNGEVILARQSQTSSI
jgi:glucose-6-phosphate isomerase